MNVDKVRRLGFDARLKFRATFRTLDAENGTATLSLVRTPQKGGAQAALGFAARFRKTRRTADWLRGVDDTELMDPQGREKR